MSIKIFYRDSTVWKNLVSMFSHFKYFAFRFECSQNLHFPCTYMLYKIGENNSRKEEDMISSKKVI